MEEKKGFHKGAVIAIPLAVLAVTLVLAGGVLRVARASTDVANARLLLVVAGLALADPSPPAPLSEFLDEMPTPTVHGALHRYEVFVRDGVVSVFAMEDESTGYRYDAAAASFEPQAAPVGDAGVRLDG